MATTEEQETIINYFPREKLISVYTAYPPHIRKITGDNRFTIVKEYFDSEGNIEAIDATTQRTGHLNILTLAQRAQQELTDEQRTVRAARMRSLHSKSV